MKIHHHPDDATLMAYAAGNVTEGFSLVLAAHLENCPHCRQRMAELEELGGELMSELVPVQTAVGGFDQLWERIAQEPVTREAAPKPVAPTGGEVPGILHQYLGDSLDSIAWKTMAPGVKQYLLDDVDSDKGSVRLLSIAPGVTIPHHTHNGGELTLVLRGSYADEVGRFRAGDLADLDASVEHQPVADSEETCICLIATDDKLRFSGMLGRMMQPFIGI